MNVVYFMAGNTDLVPMCYMSIDSIRIFHPDAKFYIYTDMDVSISGTTVFKMPEVPRDQLMPASVGIIVDFMNREEMDGPTLFLDPDILMNQPFEMPPADVMVTYRKGLGELSRQMPYNTGVIAMDKTKEAQLFAQVYMGMNLMQSERNQKWYGDQLAMAALLGHVVPEEPSLLSIQVEAGHGVEQIMVFAAHCDQFNWTPDDPQESPDGRTFIHLKGKRKQWMPGYLRDIKMRGEAA